VTAVQPLGTPIDRVLAQVRHKGAGQGKWVARCPAHDDRMESLSIKVGTDGRVLLKCHAGCGTRDICAAIGLTMADLFAESLKRTETNTADPKNRPRIVKSWDYMDASGTLLFQSCRFEYPATPGEKTRKKFSQRQSVNGEWVYNLDGIQPVLYRLPEIIEAVSLGRLIWIAEGEKCVDALVEAGFHATCNPMGAGKWKDEYSKVLAGAAVVILPDNDETGRKHAEDVAQSLHKAGATVRIVKLPGLPPKGDVVDWFDAGGDSADLGEIPNRTAPWGPPGPRRVRWKLAELWNNEIIMRPPPHVVPRLAWAGRSTLLAAREKAGKSTLIGYITSRVSRGESFLGEYCVKGDVLIIGLEEYLGDVARRLKHFGADGDRVTLVDGFLGEPADRPREIQNYIEDITPALCVVDSLVAFANGRGIDENDAAMATIVQPLTDMAHATGTALIVVHHANKSAGKARGSTAITGATDVVCEFFAKDEDAEPNVRSMRSVGRVPLIRQYDLHFDGTTYELGNGAEAPIEPRIIAIIRERPGISTSDVVDAIGRRKDDVVKALQRMQVDQVIRNQSNQFNRAKWVVPAQQLL
jgi:putative DNA primase/helicase